MITHFIRIIFYSLALLLLLSCRTHRDTVSRTDHELYEQLFRTDTARTVVQRIDSVYRHDSIFINTSTRNDTVFVLKEFYHNYYHHERESHKDSTAHSETQKTQETDEAEQMLEEVTVTPPNPFHDLKWKLGCVILAGLLIIIVYYEVKKKPR